MMDLDEPVEINADEGEISEVCTEEDDKVTVLWEPHITQECIRGRSEPITTQPAVPVRSTEKSAGYDLLTTKSGRIRANTRKLVSMGFRMKINKPNVCGKIYSRSGLKFHSGIEVVSAPSIIDPDFSGIVQVPMENRSGTDFNYRAGQRLAQMMFEPFYPAEFVSVPKNTIQPETSRNTGGFGSTGM